MPEPVGPVTSTAPWLRVIERSSTLAVGGSHARGWSSSITDAALVEDAEDRGLAAHHRQGRDADVDEAAVDGQADPSVLWRPALGDVEVGHDLEPRDQPGGHPLRDRRGVHDDPVDAKTDLQVAVARDPGGCRRLRGSTASAITEWTSFTTGASSAEARSSIAARRLLFLAPTGPRPRRSRCSRESWLIRAVDVLRGGDHRRGRVRRSRCRCCRGRAGSRGRRWRPGASPRRRRRSGSPGSGEPRRC